MAKEEYKRIKGYEDYYLISNWGRVVRINKHTPLKQIKWRVKRKTGYCEVMLCRPVQMRKYCLVHRLVAEHFIPNDDAGKFEVDHKDGNKRNNSWTNLEWVTPKENSWRRTNL